MTSETVNGISSEANELDADVGFGQLGLDIGK